MSKVYDLAEKDQAVAVECRMLIRLIKPDVISPKIQSS
jgi:hypothetical protein